MKKFTVSVLTYKRNAMLSSCIQSLLKMSARPSEILIIDQNPTDTLKKTLDRFAGRNKDMLFSYIFMGEAHIAKGRKKALETARYDYLLFTDDDCRVDREWAYYALSQLDAGHPLVAGKCLPDRKNDTLVSRILHEQTEQFFALYREGARTKHMRSYLMDPKNCALNRKTILGKNLMYDSHQFWLEDMDFSFQAYRKKIPIVVEERMVVTHTYIYTVFPAIRSQFRLGYAFETLLRRWKNVPEVRALIAYSSQKNMYNKRSRLESNPLALLFSLARSAGYLFGTIRSFYSGRSSDG